VRPDLPRTASVKFSDCLQTLSSLDREVKLLREYRARLVTDVATSKLHMGKAALLQPRHMLADSSDTEADLGDEPELADEEIGM